MHHLRVETLSRTVSTALHLARRFFGALRSGGPNGADEAWVASILEPAPLLLWHRMSGPDRRHAAGVARLVSTSSDDPAVLAAALLHDVGKIESGLGTFARVFATLVGLAGGRARASRWTSRHRGARRRVGLYLHHPVVGSDLLAAAGAAPLTVAWAAEHHLPEARWTIPHATGRLLKDADDD